MAERCLTLGCPEVVRLSLQDDCSGAPVPGVANGYVLSCIRNWGVTPIVREGDTSEFTSDCGKVVARNKQDDVLTGYTISFETSVRSNELESLLTGKDLISSGGLNIGTYGVNSAVGCVSDNTDPRFFVEAFYKLNTCVTAANHVRWVLPLAQFKVTEVDKEGTITFYRYTAETNSSLATEIGDGPYLDLPADVATFLAARDPAEYTTGFDFEENITISGSCGFVEVPEAGPPVITASCTIGADDFVTTVTSTGPGNITMTGTFPDFASFSAMILDGSASDPTYFPSDPEVITLNATTISITDTGVLSTQTISGIEIDGLADAIICTFDPPIVIS